jgi:peptide deformylase
MNHAHYITHIKNKEDEVYLRNKHFPVNMRLFKTSPEYKSIILQQCEYIRMLCLTEKEGYKKPHGMSSANAGLAFNIIGITRNRGRKDEYCQIMINPEITSVSEETSMSNSNCGSVTLDKPMLLYRHDEIVVRYFDEESNWLQSIETRASGGFTIQHEVDHNLGILITDNKR